MGRYQSGQLGQTVNLLALAFVGSNPTRPTILREAKDVLRSSNFVKSEGGLKKCISNLALRYGWHAVLIREAKNVLHSFSEGGLIAMFV